MRCSLQIGQTRFDNPFIQGPLAGISCAPFRELVWRYSQPAYTCTEMISCQTLNHAPFAVLKRYITKHRAEGPLCFQLAGHDPHDIATAVKKVTDYGADLIDLNCGCPVKKIRQKGMGSRLLQDSTKLYHAISAMKENTHVPVTVKIRVQGKSSFAFNQEIAAIVADAGADALVVHGRHWTEHYETPCQYEQIQFFVEALSIPVIGNGDVSDAMSLKKMLATGCAGVMIARYGVGQPWLIQHLQALLQGKAFNEPTLYERGQAYLCHVKGLVDLLDNEKQAVLQARGFAKYYARQLPFQLAWVNAVNQCVSVDDLVKTTKAFYW